MGGVRPGRALRRVPARRQDARLRRLGQAAGAPAGDRGSRRGVPAGARVERRRPVRHRGRIGLPLLPSHEDPCRFRRRRLLAPDRFPGADIPDGTRVERPRGAARGTPDRERRLCQVLRARVRDRRHRPEPGAERRRAHAGRQEPRLRAGGPVLAAQRTADARRAGPQVPVVPGHHGLLDPALVPGRRLLLAHAAGLTAGGRQDEPRPRRGPGRDVASDEDQVMDEPRFHPLDYLSVVRRRKWWFVVPLVLALTVGGALALFLPKEYLSSATVGIAAPAVSSDLARSAGPMDQEERVRVISQQLLSRPVLGRVVQSEHPGLAPDEVDTAIARLRTKIQPITFPTPIAPAGNQRLDSFIVSYLDRTPEGAQRVTNRLVEVFVDETTRVRATRAEGTTAFLDVQVRDAQAKLGATEERLRDAKQLNIGRLPEQTGANLQTLNGLRQQLESTNIALRGEQDRLSMVDRQLEAMRQGTEGMPLLRGNGNGDMGMVPR
ncbi:MAG: hypothetical protein EHM24_13410, partial [Acidobacteria bacterium]